MNKHTLVRGLTSAVATLAIAAFCTQSVSAQNKMSMSGGHHKDHYSSNVHIGGSWGAQSGYNNHQHHNLVPHRKYYTYHGNQFYIDLDTGLRFRI